MLEYEPRAEPEYEIVRRDFIILGVIVIAVAAGVWYYFFGLPGLGGLEQPEVAEGPAEAPSEAPEEAAEQEEVHEKEICVEIGEERLTEKYRPRGWERLENGIKYAGDDFDILCKVFYQNSSLVAWTYSIAIFPPDPFTPRNVKDIVRKYVIPFEGDFICHSDFGYLYCSSRKKHENGELRLYVSDLSKLEEKVIQANLKIEYCFVSGEKLISPGCPL